MLNLRFAELEPRLENLFVRSQPVAELAEFFVASLLDKLGGLGAALIQLGDFRPVEALRQVGTQIRAQDPFGPVKRAGQIDLHFDLLE